MQEETQEETQEDLLKKLTGLKIKQIRERHGWTQQHLAVKVGVESDSQVRKWEGGKRFPEPKNLIRLAKALEVRVRDLFDFPDSDL